MDLAVISLQKFDAFDGEVEIFPVGVGVGFDELEGFSIFDFIISA